MLRGLVEIEKTVQTVHCACACRRSKQMQIIGTGLLLACFTGHVDGSDRRGTYVRQGQSIVLKHCPIASLVVGTSLQLTSVHPHSAGEISPTRVKPGQHKMVTFIT